MAIEWSGQATPGHLPEIGTTGPAAAAASRDIADDRQPVAVMPALRNTVLQVRVRRVFVHAATLFENVNTTSKPPTKAAEVGLRSPTTDREQPLSFGAVVKSWSNFQSDVGWVSGASPLCPGARLLNSGLR